MRAWMRFYIKYILQASYIGSDRSGNRYFISKKRRFVLYKKEKEASAVPPLWHSWLHQNRDHPPVDLDISWNHIPNCTGTVLSHKGYPPTLSHTKHAPWRP